MERGPGGRRCAGVSTRETEVIVSSVVGIGVAPSPGALVFAARHQGRQVALAPCLP